ncbi:hypothetical protein [Streptomyces sp. 1331.2]|uniref:hypothetical protein n=1 Tax=Streptomyces sp. 1331.2 TaxID=1938835 RepID=UPI000BC9EF31|nr:hypothetical protein [Streptomyces sp. 1331.2]SOB88507.1 hypothetical protein SAMN06272789_6792 [Streptomyces sp. 1331.2]
MTSADDLTDAQMKAFEENAAALDQVAQQLRSVREQARARLTAVGIIGEGDGGGDGDDDRCFLCTCQAFVPTPPHPKAPCARPGCGHPLIPAHRG